MAAMTCIRTVCAFVSAGLALCVASPASAQLYEVTHSTDPSWGTGFGNGAAYDPVHDCYFVVSGYRSVTGRFINRDGATIGTVTFDTRDGTAIAEVAYSSDVSDGAGGFGGFLTIWTLRGVPGLFGQIVAFPVGLVGPPVTIRATQPGELELNAGIAYSPVCFSSLSGSSSTPAVVCLRESFASIKTRSRLTTSHCAQREMVDRGLVQEGGVSARDLHHRSREVLGTGKPGKHQD
jgi:hypothetical protein